MEERRKKDDRPTDASFTKWVKLWLRGATGPIALPTVGRSLAGPKTPQMGLTGFEHRTFRPTFRSANHYTTVAGAKCLYVTDIAL